MAGFTVEQVVRRSLQAHGLAEPVGSIDQALRAAAGIYGSAPTSHLGLAARLDGYTPQALERERLETRSIVRVPGMRGSVFLAPRELVPAFLGLSRPRTVRRTLAGAGVTEEEQQRLSDRIDEALSDGPLAAREIRVRLGDDDPGGSLATLVLRGMAHAGRIVAADPIGGERATAYRYARMADWAPLSAPVPSVAEALAVMTPLWMRANGPATVDDLAWWAGVTKTQARAELARMGACRVEIDGLEGEAWATAEVVDGLAAADPVPAVRLLPVWDAWLMARRERARILEPAYRPFVVDRNGNVTNTITLGGQIVGTWDIDGGLLLSHCFGRVERPALESAAERLRPVIDWTGMREVHSPRPLEEGGQNAFQAPLRISVRD